MKRIINIELINFLLIKKLKSWIIVVLTMIVLPIALTAIASTTAWIQKQLGVEILIFMLPILFNSLISLPNIIINLRASSLIKRIATSRITKTHYYSSLFISALIFNTLIIIGSLMISYLAGLTIFSSYSSNVVANMFNVVENWGLLILNIFLFMSLMIITGIASGMLFNSISLLIGLNLCLMVLMLVMGGGIINYNANENFIEMYYFTPWSYNLWMIIKNIQGATNITEQAYSAITSIGFGMLITAVIYKFASFEGIR